MVVLANVNHTDDEEEEEEVLYFSSFVEMGHDAIALLLDFITREYTYELAPYRLVCKDFAASMDLYVEQLSTRFMYKKMKLKQFKKISIRIPNPSCFLQSAIGSICVHIADFEKAIPKSIGYIVFAAEFNQELKPNICLITSTH